MLEVRCSQHQQATGGTDKPVQPPNARPNQGVFHSVVVAETQRSTYSRISMSSDKGIKKKPPTVREGTVAIPQPKRSDFFQALKNATVEPPSKRRRRSAK